MTESPADGRRSRVLLIDDNPQLDPNDLSRHLSTFELDVRLHHPEDLLLEDLGWPDLVICDYFLDNWAERDDVVSVSRAPRDGIAVISNLKSALLPPLSERIPGQAPEPSPAFALWSSDLALASFDLPEPILPHVFARAVGLEWTFRRQELLDGPAGSQVASLAHAARTLPATWPSLDNAAAEVNRLLGLGAIGNGSVPWVTEALAQLTACRPPMHELSERSRGMAIVRWLLHRVLPYPTFLVDPAHLAALVMLDPSDTALLPDGSLRESLAPFEYRGILEGFTGHRWWRAGIEQWLYEVTDGRPGSRSQIEGAVRALGGSPVDLRHPVVTLGPDLFPRDRLADLGDVVRIQPDDWPLYADDAFAHVADVLADARLHHLVDPSDLDRLASTG